MNIVEPRPVAYDSETDSVDETGGMHQQKLKRLTPTTRAPVAGATTI